MWDFDYAQLRTALMKTIGELGVDNLGITLHSCRHGGSSHDRATNSRSLREIQSRGFWKQSSSVQRYEKHGRTALVVRKPYPSILTRRTMQHQTGSEPFAKFYMMLLHAEDCL